MTSAEWFLIGAGAVAFLGLVANMLAVMLWG